MVHTGYYKSNGCSVQLTNSLLKRIHKVILKTIFKNDSAIFGTKRSLGLLLNHIWVRNEWLVSV